MFAPGSTFSGIVLGTLTTARRGTELRSGSLADVVTLLQSCNMILGVRFGARGGPDDARVAAVHAVAAVRREVVDARPVLDVDGGSPSGSGARCTTP